MGGFRVIGPDEYLGPQGPSVSTALSNALMRIFQVRERQQAEEDRKARIAIESKRLQTEQQRAQTTDEEARLRLEDAKRARDDSDAGERLLALPRVAASAGPAA